MPPKAKHSRQEIVKAAIEIVRDHGLSALTARALGTKLGSSARPIFTVFQSMEEVQQETIRAARMLYTSYIDRGLAEENPFHGVGRQYIQFAVCEPKLFQLLFMAGQAHVPTLECVLPQIDYNYSKILDAVRKVYGIEDVARAEKLYRHMWIYTHGIATLCATGMCSFTGADINNMMQEMCRSLLVSIRTSEGENIHD